MSESNYKGKRYICLVRASHGTQEISTDAQLKMLRAAAEDEGMTFVYAKVVDGLTGSLPGKRKDLEELLERKRTDNDFDVLVLQRCDRLTRGGLRHGFWFEWECQKLGIELLIVGDDIPTGEHADLVKFIKYQAAKEQAFSISQRSTQGSQFALEQGRIIPSSRTPFGCWRLYLTADGKPSHIIRNVGDGRQEKPRGAESAPRLSGHPMARGNGSASLINRALGRGESSMKREKFKPDQPGRARRSSIRLRLSRDRRNRFALTFRRRPLSPSRPSACQPHGPWHDQPSGAQREPRSRIGRRSPACLPAAALPAC